jgi:N utilization substance protein B
MAEAAESSRSRGRELALVALCHLDGVDPPARGDALTLLLEQPPRGDGRGEDHFAELAADPSIRTFAVELVELVIDNWADIDARISSTSTRWRLPRMDRVDRNTIRLAAAELLLRPRTPRAVILSEAVRLASRYGGERSPPFVNGVARALADALRPDAEEVAG